MTAITSGTYGAASVATLPMVGPALTNSLPTEVATCPIGFVIFLIEKPRFYNS